MGQTLLKRTADLSDGLARLRTLQLSVRESGLVDQRVQALRTSRERLESPTAFLHAVDGRPELGQPDMAGLNPSSALATVERTRVIARDDPQAVLTGSAVPTVLAAVRQATQSVESVAESTWRRIVTSTAPPAQMELLEVLSQIPSYHQAVERLRGLDRQIRELSSSRWVSSDELGRFLSLRRQIQEQWEQLGGSEALPSEVLDFLVACAGEGATLDAMTPEIKEWIEGRELGGAFRIRFSGG